MEWAIALLLIGIIAELNLIKIKLDQMTLSLASSLSPELQASLNDISGCLTTIAMNTERFGKSN